jgi:hypothetical protein
MFQRIILSVTLLFFSSSSFGQDKQLLCQVPKEFYKQIQKDVVIYGTKNINNVAPVLFDWPVKQATGFNDPSFWGISNYFDHNSSYGQTQDYNCGTHTYDVSGYNHSGTDIYAAPFGWKMMDAGQVDVIAAADGVIIYKEDNNYDRNCNFSNPNWNVVVVQHADGVITVYGHLKTNSLTTKTVGSSVLKGEFLGKVGSSGSSTGPHLHFECIDINGNPFDPFTGTCNTGTSRWISQKTYLPTGILKVTTNSAQAIYPTCPNPEIENEENSFQIGESVQSFGYVRAMKVGQSYSLKFKNPSGVIVGDITGSQTTNQPYHGFISGAYILPLNAPLGTWQIEFTYNGEMVTKNFTVTCSPPSAPTTTSASRCGSGTVNLSASNCSGSIQWFNSATGGASFYTGSSYTTSSLTSSTTYYVSCTIGTCVSTSRTAVTATINTIPSAPTISNTTIISGQTATLTASGCSGTVNWYNVASGGSSLGTGNSFITPTLNTTTIYYASCTINNCVSNTRGSGTVTVNVCPKPTAILSGTQTITAGQSANLTVTLTGAAPWSIQINGQTYSNITASPYIIPVSPTTTTNYALITTSNSCGTGTSSGSALVTVLPNCKLPTAKLLGTQNIIVGQSAELTIEFTGKSPWSFLLNGQSYSNIQNNPYKVNVSPSSTTNYTLTSLNNSCGFGSASNTVQVVVLPTTVCDITEPNNTQQNAYFLGSDGSYSYGGNNTKTLDLCIETNNDYDWFQWNSNGKMYYLRVGSYFGNSYGYYKLIITIDFDKITITTAPIAGKQMFDSFIELFDADISAVDFDDDDGEGLYSSLTYSFPEISNPCATTINVVSPLDDIVNGIQIKKANTTLTASNKIKPSSSVQYSAGNSLLFTQGFSVEKGSTFETAIHNCTSQPPSNGEILEHATSSNFNNISPIFPEPLTGNDGINISQSRKRYSTQSSIYHSGRSGFTSNVEINNLTAYSVSVWVKTSYNQLPQGTRYAIAQCRGATPGAGKSITLGYSTENGTWFIGVDGDGILKGIEYPFINRNEWMHIVGVWNGASGSAITPEQFSLYINGKKIQGADKIQIGSALTAPISGSGHIKIGYHEAWNTCFEGGIDDLRIYNRVLSETEIQNIYFYEN